MTAPRYRVTEAGRAPVTFRTEYAALVAAALRAARDPRADPPIIEHRDHPGDWQPLPKRRNPPMTDHRASYILWNDELDPIPCHIDRGRVTVDGDGLVAMIHSTTHPAGLVQMVPPEDVVAVVYELVGLTPTRRRTAQVHCPEAGRYDITESLGGDYIESDADGREL